MQQCGKPNNKSDGLNHLPLLEFGNGSSFEVLVLFRLKKMTDEASYCFPGHESATNSWSQLLLYILSYSILGVDLLIGDFMIFLTNTWIWGRFRGLVTGWTSPVDVCCFLLGDWTAGGLFQPRHPGECNHFPSYKHLFGGFPSGPPCLRTPKGKGSWFEMATILLAPFLDYFTFWSSLNPQSCCLIISHHCKAHWKPHWNPEMFPSFSNGPYLICFLECAATLSHPRPGFVWKRARATGGSGEDGERCAGAGRRRLMLKRIKWVMYYLSCIIYSNIYNRFQYTLFIQVYI